jgi:hypothetical protein
MSKGVPVANPTPFDGNRNNTDRFLAECKLVFMAKANDFLVNPSLATSGADDPKKISFVLSYMKDKTANSFKLAWLNDPANATKTYAEFEAKLKEAFKQYDKSQRARLRLETLSQGRFTTDAYTSTFNEVAADSEFDEVAKVHFYKNGLNPEILRSIEMMDTVPTKLDDIQQKAITFGLKIDKVNSYRQPQRRTENTNNYYRHPNSGQRYPQRGTRDDPITIDRLQFQRRSDSEIRQMMGKSQCFRCAKTGHIARNCPEKGNSPRGYQHPGNSYPSNSGQHYQAPRLRPAQDQRPIRARAANFMEEFQEFCANASTEEHNELMMTIKESTPEDFVKDE